MKIEITDVELVGWFCEFIKCEEGSVRYDEVKKFIEDKVIVKGE